MSLGNPTLKSVNRSRPEILKSLSKQSVTASDDYHSCADYATDVSSVDDRAAVVRWSTPPSNARTPQGTPDHHLHSDGPPMNRRERLGPLAPAIAEVAEGRSTLPRTAQVEGDPSPPTPGVDDTPYIHYAIEQITRQDQDPRSRGSDPRSSSSTYPIERIVPPPNLVFLPTTPKVHTEVLPRKELPLPPLPAQPRPQPQPPPPPTEPPIFIPADPPPNSVRYPDLTALPAVLRAPSLALLILLCLLKFAALIFCAVWSRGHNGLWDYTDAEGGRYFLFNFFPQILASIIVLYVFSVHLAVMRVMPFVCMASDQVKLRSNALLLNMRPHSLLLPQFEYFRAGNPTIAACLLIFWLSVFTIPLQSSLFQVRWADVDGRWRWRWVTVEAIAWVLVALYVLLIVALLALGSFLLRRHTGLKWDPTCMADIMVMLQHSNSLHDYDASETFRSRREFGNRLKLRSDRLGYWRARDSADDALFYAIGEEGAPTRRYSLQQGKAIQAPLDHPDEKPLPDLEAQHSRVSVSDAKLAARIHSPLVRHRFIPWYLRDTYVIAWIVIAMVLLIAFIVVSFVRHAVRRGFLPRLDATPNHAGFSPPGFLYSFLPALIGVFLFLFWLTIDVNFRALQPFVGLSDPKGTSAENSILLDYTACLPGVVTVRAAAARHWKVAWISFVSLLSLTLPIIGGGVFWAIYFPEDREVRMVARTRAFNALVAFCVIYALSFLAVWPTRKRYLPHDTRTLAELISFLYRSPLIRDPAFHEPRSKTDLVTRLVSLAPGERQLRRYIFGTYRGVDEKVHLGIDRLHTQDAEAPEPLKEEKGLTG